MGKKKSKKETQKKTEKKMVVKNKQPKPSTERRLHLIETGKKREEFIGKFPISTNEAVAKEVKYKLLDARVKNKEVPHIVDPRRTKDMKKYWVIEKTTGEKLAYFYGKKAELGKDPIDLHYFCWYDKNGWHGCTNVNINPDTGEYNFECAGVTPKIPEKREVMFDVRTVNNAGVVDVVGRKKVKNIARYVEYLIKPDKSESTE